MGLSPMMSHYLTIKEKYPDCIIFYRLGDFYEMFFDDAIKASKILDLTLTGRDCGLEDRAPMCGVPFRAADSYISKLVGHGEKVAICEQLTPNNGKDLVKRDVIRVISAGTITDDSIDEKSNNFLASVYCDLSSCSISWVDITTGEFFAQSFSGDDKLSNLCDVLIKISPSEIICNEKAFEIFANSPFVVQGVLPKFNCFVNSEFNKGIAKSSLLKQLNVKSLTIFGIDENDDSISPAGAIISYLKQTQMHALININTIKILTQNDCMMLDSGAIRNLELIKTLRDSKGYGTLLWLLDKTKTSMGARKLQNWILSPLNSSDKIKYRLDGVQDFYNNTLIRQSITDSLSHFRDIGRLSGKISNGNLLPRDCLNLCQSLSSLPSIKFSLSGINSKIINNINLRIYDYSEICELLSRSISDKSHPLDGEYIKYGFNNELDEFRKLSKNAKNCISDIQERERERTGIKNLKIGYNRVFGYYIDVTNSFKDKIPYDYIRKQTLSNSERYITEELKDIEVKILSSEENALKLESTIYAEIKETLCKYVAMLKDTSEAIAELDVLISFANISKEKGYVRPEINTKDGQLTIVEGRHPVVEALTKQKFIPNDCNLDSDENRTAIITGPNMAGKSTYMRQTALIVLMSHIGCFVPAKRATIPIVDKIFTRIGASDNLTSDQSTFMVEMSETAYILKNATKHSLIILDEIGRGTSTYDGLSIAWAVVEYITSRIGAKTLFATHYHELTALEGKLEGVKNYKISVKEFQGSIIFLRKIMRGSANRSFGIEVAELAGIDKIITNKAKEILSKLEKDRTILSSEFSIDKQEDTKSLSEIEKILAEINLDNITPMQAFAILNDLQEKVVEK